MSGLQNALSGMLRARRTPLDSLDRFSLFPLCMCIKTRVAACQVFRGYLHQLSNPAPV